MKIFRLTLKQHESPCKQLCINILKNKPVGLYWINVIQNICKKYLLPDPLLLLEGPVIAKETWKKLCKESVLKEENDMLTIELFKNKYFKYIHPLDYSINRKAIHPVSPP